MMRLFRRESDAEKAANARRAFEALTDMVAPAAATLLYHELYCFGIDSARHPSARFTQDPADGSRFICPTCRIVMRFIVEKMP